MFDKKITKTKAFQNNYLDRVQSICSLLDHARKENKVDMTTQKQIIIALATYFLSNTHLFHYHPPSLNTKNRVGENFEWYFRTGHHGDFLVQFWEEQLRCDKKDEEIFEILFENTSLTYLDLEATKILSSHSKIKDVQGDDSHLPKIFIVDTMKSSHTFLDSNEFGNHIQKIFKENNFKNNDDVLRFFSDNIFIFEDINLKSTTSNMLSPFLTLHDYLKQIYQYYLDWRATNTSIPLLTQSYFFHGLNYCSIDKSTKPFLSIHHYETKNKLDKIEQKKLSKFLLLLDHHKSMDPATLTEYFLSLYYDEKLSSRDLVWKIIDTLSDHGEIANLLKMKLSEFNKKISPQYSTRDYLNKISDKLDELKNVNHPFTLFYINLIEKSLSRFDYKDEVLTPNCLDSILNYLNGIEELNKPIKENNVYFLVWKIYEEMKIISIMNHQNKENKNLLSTLGISEDMSFYYVPFAMNAIPCLLETGSSLSNSPSHLLNTSNSDFYFESAIALEEVQYKTFSNNETIFFHGDKKKYIEQYKIDENELAEEYQRLSEKFQKLDDGACVYIENKKMKLDEIDLKNLPKNTCIVVDMTYKITSKRLNKLIVDIKKYRNDISLVAVSSLNKFASAGINISSLGCVMIYKNSPYFKEIEEDVLKLNKLCNPLQIKWYESIGTDFIKTFEKHCFQATKKIYSELNEVAKKMFYREFGCLTSFSGNFEDNFSITKFMMNLNWTLKDEISGFKIHPLSSFGTPLTTYCAYGDKGDRILRINIGHLTEDQCHSLAESLNKTANELLNSQRNSY